jgi:hypothetical protein
MLYEFRQRLDLAKLRHLNRYLLQPLLDDNAVFDKTVALIDSTDLPAATNGYKKIQSANTSPAEPISARAVVRMVRAAISSATKNTLCGFGFANILPRCCWCR